MELLSPAGNVQKLRYAFAYGADAAYVGFEKFSLRAKSENFCKADAKKVLKIKKEFPQKKIYCALNVIFHEEELRLLLKNIPALKKFSFDAFIVQDLGAVPILQKHFPAAALHLSTQASCINSEAAKMYQRLGFKRIVLGREASLSEIRQIKNAAPDLELEAFVHGAMCIAYSGRCLLSAYLMNRSAQSGFCSHSCRWNFNLAKKAEAKKFAESENLFLEEEKRRGEFFPVFEGENFSAIFSSKDLEMIGHLSEMKRAGLDALKIEGRMKSVYYTAIVTRAYKKALDALEGKITKNEAAPFVSELKNVRSRETTTGFYFDASEANKAASGASDSPYEFCGTLGKKLSQKKMQEIFSIAKKTQTLREEELNSLHPAAKAARLKDWALHPQKAPPPLKECGGWKMYEFDALNLIGENDEFEFVFPNNAAIFLKKGEWLFANPQDGCLMAWTSSGRKTLLYTKHELLPYALARKKDAGFVEGKVRDAGRGKTAR